MTNELVSYGLSLLVTLPGSQVADLQHSVAVTLTLPIMPAGRLNVAEFSSDISR